MKRRMLGAMLATALVLAAVAMFTGVAFAGGSNWSLDRDRYQPGDVAVGWASIAWEHNPTLGTPDDGPYYAWVTPAPMSVGVPGQLIPDSAIRVAQVTVSLEPCLVGGIRFGPHCAGATFTVPELPPGQYHLLHANAAGTSTLGDLTGMSTFWVDPAGAARATAVRSVPAFAG